MSVLSKPDILKHRELGNIIIEPFREKNIANTSYDVRLGKYYFRPTQLDHAETLNPFYEKSVQKIYPELREAVPVKKVRSLDNPYHGLDDDDLLILIGSGETILGHTIEFIGGKNGIPGSCSPVTTEMRARSSLGRIGIAVCKCAGWGDVGYVNRWTMEITNFSPAVIPLVVGMRIAQIIFHEVSSPIVETDLYHNLTGKYQSAADIEELKKNWQPDQMLPKLYKDTDLGHFQEFYN
jgi:dCTP deaminase